MGGGHERLQVGSPGRAEEVGRDPVSLIELRVAREVRLHDLSRLVPGQTLGQGQDRAVDQTQAGDPLRAGGGQVERDGATPGVADQDRPAEVQLG